MKNNIINNGKWAVVWIFLLWVSSFYNSCTDESLFGASEGAVGSGNEVVLLVNVNMPEAAVPTARTRAQTANEYQVSEVSVLVFEKPGNEYVFDYRINGEFLSQDDDPQAQFQALLVATDNPVKLYVLINATVALEEYTLTAGMTEAQVRALLKMDFTANGMETNLPMFGEIEITNGLDPLVQQSVNVNVLRSIARVDVIVDLESWSGRFELEDVYIFRANDLIQVIPDAFVAGVIPRVDTPSVPVDAGLLAAYIKFDAQGNDSIAQIYLPESTGIVNDIEKLTGKTTIVVGGVYENNPKSYYRIDFNSGLAGHPFGQILRNYRYEFRIKNVMGQGWTDPELAANNIATAMTIEAITWEDFSTDAYFTGNEQFAVSSREISLRYMANRERSLYVESTLDYAIQWLENGSPSGNMTNEKDVEIQNGDFSVKIVHDSTDPANVNRLVFKTLHDNYANPVVDCALRIWVNGLWSMDIDVTQDNAAKFFDRTINVMSVGPVGSNSTGVGNFGSSLGSTSNGSANAMRNMIEINFSPGGKIPIGGTIFSLISVGDANTSDSSILSAVKRVINGQDVIYFTYRISVTTEIANYLVEWLRASPHRVLIVSLDSSDSNVNLRNHSYVSTGTAWTFGNISSAANSGYIRANSTANSDYFFNGPFGAVSQDVVTDRSDDIAGYTSTNITDVTPLVTSSTPGSQNIMVMGINISKRIIYQGDANLFMRPSMDNLTGNIVNENDKLMANLWAWVVEQVIYGDE